MPRAVLLTATSIAEAIPDRFWLPSRAGLAALEPGTAWVKAEAVEVDDDGSADLAAMAPSGLLWRS